MATTATPASPEKRKRTRSPQFPFINLETALIRARQFYDQEKRNAVNVAVATKDWGFADNSSSGAQTIATLTSFGLMQDEGIGDRRTVRLSPNALRILLDQRPDSTERAELIKQAALAPKIHQQLWEKLGADMPSDAQIRHMLLFDWPVPFNENAVDGFIRQYRDTIAFAKLIESDKVASEVKDSGDSKDETPYVAQIGDWVQWERSSGDLGFPEPKRVKGLSPDGNWAYVDGQYGAVERNQLIHASAPENLPDPKPTQRMPSPPKTYMQEFVVPLSDGNKAVFQYPNVLTQADVDDLKDSLKILERKISRSVEAKEQANASKEE